MKTLAIISAIALAALVCAGCSDDVTCPEQGEFEDEPFISGELVEYVDDEGAYTRGYVFCSSDPLPDFFVAFINRRQLQPIRSMDPVGVEVRFEEDVVVWQPGTVCSLEVTTDFGYAIGRATVPGAFSVTAPDSAALGDTLAVTWEPSENADFYTVSATIVEESPADTLTLFARTAATSVEFLPSEITIPGVMSGRVAAISGPMPYGGSDGNVEQNGWGFFTVSYYDTAAMFQTAVTDTTG